MSDLTVEIDIVLNNKSFLAAIKQMKQEMAGAFNGKGGGKSDIEKMFDSLKSKMTKGIKVPLNAIDNVTPVIDKIRANAAKGINIPLNPSGGVAGSGGGGSSRGFSGVNVSTSASDLAEGIRLRGYNRRAEATRTGRNAVAYAAELANDESRRGNIALGRGQELADAIQLRQTNRRLAIEGTGNRARAYAKDLATGDRLQSRENTRLTKVYERSINDSVKAHADNEQFRIEQGEVAGEVAGEARQAGYNAKSGGLNGQGGAWQGGARLKAFRASQDKGGGEGGLGRLGRLAGVAYATHQIIDNVGKINDEVSFGSRLNRLSTADQQLSAVAAQNEANYTGARGLAQGFLDSSGITGLFNFESIDKKTGKLSGFRLESREEKDQIIRNAQREQSASEIKIQRRSNASANFVSGGFDLRRSRAGRTDLIGTRQSQINLRNVQADERIKDYEDQASAIDPTTPAGKKQIALLNQRIEQEKSNSGQDFRQADATSRSTDYSSQYNISQINAAGNAAELRSGRNYLKANAEEGIANKQNALSNQFKQLSTIYDKDQLKRASEEYKAQVITTEKEIAQIRVEYSREVAIQNASIDNQTLSFRRQAAGATSTDQLRSFQESMRNRIASADASAIPGLYKQLTAGESAINAGFGRGATEAFSSATATSLRLNGANVEAGSLELENERRRRLREFQGLNTPESRNAINAINSEIDAKQRALETNATRGRQHIYNSTAVNNLRNIGRTDAANYLEGKLNYQEQLQANKGDPLTTRALEEERRSQLQGYIRGASRVEKFSGYSQYAESLQMRSLDRDPKSIAAATKELKDINKALLNAPKDNAKAMADAGVKILVVGK